MRSKLNRSYKNWIGYGDRFLWEICSSKYNWPVKNHWDILCHSEFIFFSHSFGLPSTITRGKKSMPQKQLEGLPEPVGPALKTATQTEQGERIIEYRNSRSICTVRRVHMLLIPKFLPRYVFEGGIITPYVPCGVFICY